MSAPYLRNASDSRFTTLGRELTITEGDQQFIYIKDQIDGLKSVAGLTPYDSVATYVGGKTYVVGYGNKGWLFISSTDQSGVTPGTNSAIWQEINPNSLTHQQNTDAYLGYGTSDEVSANELRSFLDAANAPVALTHADFLTLFLGGTLTKDVVYKITDKSLYVRAMSNRSFEGNGLIERIVPNWQGYSGGLHPVWFPDAEPGINDKTIFADKVYKNLTGTNLTTIPPDDLDNWEEVAGNTSDYKIDYYGCRVLYRRDENRIAAFDIITSTQDKVQSIEFNTPSYNSRFNTANISIVEGSSQLIDSNKDIIIGVTKQNRGALINNSGSNGSIGVIGNHLGEFKNNHIINTNLAVASGTTSGFKFNGNNVEFKFGASSGKTINLRNNAVIEDCVINSKGSDAVDVLDGSSAVTGSTLDLNANGANDAYGIFEIDVADITIDSLTGMPSHFEKIIIRPSIGRTITVTSYASSFVSANGQIVDNGVGGGWYELTGNDGDYVVVSRRTVGGFNVYYLEQFIIPA